MLSEQPQETSAIACLSGLQGWKLPAAGYFISSISAVKPSGQGGSMVTMDHKQTSGMWF